MTKVCTKCGVEKELTGFYKSSTTKTGRHAWCKVCVSAYTKSRRSAVNEHQRKRRAADPFYQQKAKEYRDRTKDRIRKRDKEYRRENRKKLNAYNKEYYKTHKEAGRLRSRLASAMNGKAKAGSAVRDLGCDMDEFKLYLENQFYDRSDGTKMTWENQGEWHLDHVMPLSKFDLTDRTEFLEACNYLNIQPLWAEDNLSKGAR